MGDPSQKSKAEYVLQAAIKGVFRKEGSLKKGPFKLKKSPSGKGKGARVVKEPLAWP